MNRERSFLLPREVVEELNCSICLESKTLCVLPCQHRLCHDCIENLAEHRRRINCPNCRHEWNIPVEGFPVCRLTRYFREQLHDLDAANEQRREDAVTCHHCQKKVEAKCRFCENFLCYKCVMKTKCSQQSEVHESIDLADLARNADNALESWKTQTVEQLGVLKRQSDQMQKRIADKESIIKLFEANIACESRLDRILFVDKLTARGSITEPEPAATAPDNNLQADISEQVVETKEVEEIIKSVTMTDTLLNEEVTSVCFTSGNQAIAGTFAGSLMAYDKSGGLKETTKTSGAVWSVCEDRGSIYAQCGENTIEVFSKDLKRFLRRWTASFTVGKIATLNGSVYATNPNNKVIAKFSPSGQQVDSITHPSFAYPVHIKPYMKDSIIISDAKAECIFMYKNDVCIWQTGLPACSGIAVDQSNGNIWVKRLNKKTLTVLSAEGQKLGTIDINSMTSSIKHDMAVNGNKLYLASNNGLLTSTPKSSICIIS